MATSLAALVHAPDGKYRVVTETTTLMLTKKESQDVVRFSTGTTFHATFHRVSKVLEFAIQPLPTTAPLQNVDKYLYVAMELAKALGATKMRSDDTAAIPTSAGNIPVAWFTMTLPDANGLSWYETHGFRDPATMPSFEALLKKRRAILEKTVALFDPALPYGYLSLKRAIQKANDDANDALLVTYIKIAQKHIPYAHHFEKKLEDVSTKTILSLKELVHEPIGDTYTVLFDGWQYPMAISLDDKRHEVYSIPSEGDIPCFKATYSSPVLHIDSILYGISRTACNVPAEKTGTKLLALAEALARALGALKITLEDASTIVRNQSPVSLAIYHMAATDTRTSWYESKGFRASNYTSLVKYQKALKVRDHIFKQKVGDVLKTASDKTGLVFPAAILRLPLDKAITTATDDAILKPLVLLAKRVIAYPRDLEKRLKQNTSHVLAYGDLKRLRTEEPQ